MNDPVEGTSQSEDTGAATISVDLYTVKYGDAQVSMVRENGRWRLGDGGSSDHWGPLFDDEELEVMTAVAVEYAKRIDEAKKAKASALQAETDVHNWVQDEVARRHTEIATAAERRNI